MPKWILFRDESKDSAAAAKLLKDHGIEFVEVFKENTPHTLPFVLTGEDAYPFVGLGQINFVVRDEVERHAVA